MRKWILFTLLFCCLGIARSQAPAVFYSDLISGPATGGQGSTNGAFVCVFGENFGATQGTSTISIGGTNASSYPVWTDPGAPYIPGHYAKACFQIAAATPTGLNPIILTTTAGSSTNYPCSSIPTSSYPLAVQNYPCFTVRSGNIYFVSTTGNDSTGTGAYTAPWATTAHAIGQATAGTIIYAENGVTESTQQGSSSAVININNTSGTTGNPIMVGAYPGATITGTSTAGERIATDYVNSTTAVNHWGLFGWTLMCGGACGEDIELQPFNGVDMRFVNNTMTCTGGGCDGKGAAFDAEVSSQIFFLGNYTHDVGCHEDFPTYSASVHPCLWVNGSATLTTSGTTATFSGYDGNVSVGDVIQAASQLREVVAWSGSGNVFTLDSAFSSPLLGASYQVRDFVPQKTFHSVYISSNSNSFWGGYNEIDGSEGHAFRGIQFNSTPETCSLSIVPSSTSIASTATFTTQGLPYLMTGIVDIKVTGGSGFTVSITADSTPAAAAAILNANSTFTSNNLTATSTSNSLIITGQTGTGGSKTIVDLGSVLFYQGDGQYDLHVFNNYIHDTYGDAINFTTVAPQNGTVEAMNNILMNCGVEAYWFPPSSYGGQACIQFDNAYNQYFTPGTGTQEAYNNSAYGWGYTACSQTAGCGTPQTTEFQDAYTVTGAGSATAPNIRVLLTNNIAYATPTSGPYFAAGGETTGWLCVTGTSDPFCPGPSTGNEWYPTSGPSYTASNVNANPNWVSPSSANFHLQSGSPAISAGTTSGVPFDADGLAQTSPWTIGAYTYQSGSSYTLTVSTTTGTGTGTINITNNCQSGSFTSGTTIGPCTATPNGGSVFAGWTGTLGCTGTGTCTASLTGNSTMNAVFNLAPTSAPATMQGIGSIQGTAVIQ